MGVLIILFYFLFPAIILKLSTKYTIINKIGVIVICYAGGLILGNAHIIPESIIEVQDSLIGFSILLGIPLVLFSENVMKWAKMAKYTFISLLLGVASVVVLVFAGYFIFRERIPEIWKISGMMIGVYTGGTPNLAAIATSLGVDREIYLLTHTVELVIGAVVILFLITAAKPLFGLFLKPYKSNGNADQPDLNVSEFESFDGFFDRSGFPHLLKAFGIAVVIFGLGYGMIQLMSILVPDKPEAGTTAAVLTVTSLGILASLVPRINEIKRSFQLGMYFIYVFSVIVASIADVTVLFAQENMDLLLNMFLFIALVIIGSLLLHALLSKIFGISVDDYIITSTALSNSPPFVPVVAAALRNKEVVVPGMIIGVVGYAIGNYLGVAIAYLLK
ncbi:MAG: DUF819 family protein [Bacteroidota bacterium]